MNNLTSKLQYKTYEKGEFSEKQSRSLEETIALIENFPWDLQRGVDVQPTGPGVVIEGPKYNYLKVGIYFNNKFTVYYLDDLSHLYEYHTESLQNVNQKVTEFFNQNIQLKAFEKHFFSSNKSNFTDASFWYATDKRDERFRLVFLAVITAGIFIMLAIMATLGILCNPHSETDFIIPVLILLFPCVFIYPFTSTTRVYRRSIGRSLWIAKGHDELIFEADNEKKTFSKSSIAEVNIYGHLSNRGRNAFTIMEMKFKDGQSIKFSGMVISPLTLLTKLKDDIRINRFEQSGFIRRSIRQF